jgi:predicted transglutaminase-like cysteine proteinase
LLTFGAGLFAGTSGSEADAVDSNPTAIMHLASLQPDFQQPNILPQPNFRLLSPEPLIVGPPKAASLPVFAPVDSYDQTPEPFGIGTAKLISGGLVQKWRNVSNGVRVEQRLLDTCRQNTENCVPAAKRFLAVVEIGRKAQGRARIGLINRAINLLIRPVSDKEQYGVDDLWATPLMTFASGAGDCEDYAIAKYVALREAGIAETDIRLVVVRDNAVHDYHAITAVRDNGHWLILDNRTLAIRDSIDIAEFNPLFAIGNAGVRRIEAAKPYQVPTYAKASPAGARPVRMVANDPPRDEPPSSRGPGLPLFM